MLSNTKISYVYTPGRAPVTFTVSPAGTWLAQVPRNVRPALAVADLGGETPAPDIQVAVQHARPWRRTARAGIYDPHFVQDSRSENRTAF